MEYVYVIGYMLISSPIVIVLSQLIDTVGTAWAHTLPRAIGRFVLFLSFGSVMALRALALFVLFTLLMRLAISETDGFRQVDVLLIAICVPYGLYFAFMALAAGARMLKAPFTPVTASGQTP